MIFWREKMKKSEDKIICDPTCPYFPDMEVPVDEWVYDEKIPFVKRRKNKKKFVCLYDGHELDWYKCNLASKKAGETK